MSFSDLDFYLQQREDNRRWLQPVILAMVVHVVTFALSATLPDLLDRKPILDEIVTVNLVSLPDVAAPSQPPPGRVETGKSDPVVKPEAAVKIPVEPAAVTPPAKKVKPVSLKPVKRKVRKTDPQKLAQEKARKKQEQERQEALARAQLEEEKAKKAAEDARAALAEMIRRQNIQQPAASSGRRSSGDRQVNNIVAQNYYAALYDRVKQFWVLPEMRKWDASLETVVVVTILRDGSIARTVIEKRSKDPYFDQFAMKTLRKAAPLPGMPKMLKKDSVEIGFRFRPGELSTTGN